MLFFSKRTVVVALSLVAILVSINGYTANLSPRPSRQRRQ
jgi:Na+/melibiose symporter-like transporter